MTAEYDDIGDLSRRLFALANSWHRQAHAIRQQKTPNNLLRAHWLDTCADDLADELDEFTSLLPMWMTRELPSDHPQLPGCQ